MFDRVPRGIDIHGVGYQGLGSDWYDLGQYGVLTVRDMAMAFLAANNAKQAHDIALEWVAQLANLQEHDPAKRAVLSQLLGATPQHYFLQHMGRRNALGEMGAANVYPLSAKELVEIDGSVPPGILSFIFQLVSTIATALGLFLATLLAMFLAVTQEQNSYPYQQLVAL